MGVNVEVCGGEEEDDDREYPWLGHGPCFVVLFSSRSVGTVVAGDDEAPEGFRVGDHACDWDMDMFEPFCGSVTLSNDDCDVLCASCEEDDE